MPQACKRIPPQSTIIVDAGGATNAVTATAIIITTTTITTTGAGANATIIATMLTTVAMIIRYVPDTFRIIPENRLSPWSSAN